MTPANYNPIKGTEIRLVSLTGQIIQYVRNTDRTGESLSCSITRLKYGGVSSVEFSVRRDTNIPSFPGMIVEVWKDGEKNAIAYAETIPQPQSTDPLITISCLGFMQKLNNKKINKTYSNTTLTAILTDLTSDFAMVDILYDVSKIVLPTTNITEISFEDASLMDVVKAITQVANKNYQNAEYRWYIDNDRYLNFELISQDAITGIYEGFNFQDPEVEEDDTKLVNRVLLYKADPADDKKLTYVGTSESTDSQGKYGIHEKKVVFPATMDNSTLTDYGRAIIERFKDPLIKVSIDNLVDQNLMFRFYKLSGRIDTFWQLISECDSFDNWDLSNITITTAELSTEKVLTGRQSIKCSTNDGSFGEYIENVFPSPIFGPTLFRLYIYLEEALNVSIILFGTDGQEHSFSFGVTETGLKIYDYTDKGLRLDVGLPEVKTLPDGTVKTLPDGTEKQALVIPAVQVPAPVDKTIVDGTLKTITDGTQKQAMQVPYPDPLAGMKVGIQAAYVGDWLKVEIPVDAFAISKARVLFQTDTISALYLDRMELKARSYFTNKLTLEKSVTELTKDYSISKAEFGFTVDTLHDTIKEQVKDGDLALAVAAKQ